MSVAPAIRSLRTAAIVRLKEAVTLVAGRVLTAPIDQNTPYPYLVIGSYSERAAGHYGHGGSENGFDIRGVVRIAPPETGDAELLALYEEVYLALHEHPLTPAGHQETLGTIRLVAAYRDPDDAAVLHFVARFEALTAVAQ